jgi:hypothetical protein
MIQENDKEIIYEQNMQEQCHQLRYRNQQQKQHLSLGDISPIWNSRLKGKQSALFLISLTRLQWLFEIIHPKKCVVAEHMDFHHHILIIVINAQVLETNSHFTLQWAFLKKLRRIKTDLSNTGMKNICRHKVRSFYNSSL